MSNFLLIFSEALSSWWQWYCLLVMNQVEVPWNVSLFVKALSAWDRIYPEREENCDIVELKSLLSFTTSSIGSKELFCQSSVLFLQSNFRVIIVTWLVQGTEILLNIFYYFFEKLVWCLWLLTALCSVHMRKRHKMLIVNMVFFETRLGQMPTNWNKTKKDRKRECYFMACQI